MLNLFNIHIILIIFSIILFLYFFIVALRHLCKLIKMKKANIKKYKNLTPRKLNKIIYSTKYVSQNTIEKNLSTAYEEFRFQNSLLNSKLSFFFTIQSIFGGLFAFIYANLDIYNNSLASISFLFAVSSFLLFNNIENINNKIANIRCYILNMEQLNNQPLMNFFENGFYKQNFDSDRNILVFFTFFIIMAWVCLGIFFLFGINDKTTTNCCCEYFYYTICQ